MLPAQKRKRFSLARRLVAVLVPGNLSGRRSRRTSPMLVRKFLKSTRLSEPVLNHSQHNPERSLVVTAIYLTLSRRKLAGNPPATFDCRRLQRPRAPKTRHSLGGEADATVSLTAGFMSSVHVARHSQATPPILCRHDHLRLEMRSQKTRLLPC